MAEDTNINVNGQNEGANGGAGDNNNNNNNNGAGEGNEPKTYTQEEVDKLLQSEADRRVSEALKKQAKKNEEKVREAEKLAKMSADEKYEYELDKEGNPTSSYPDKDNHSIDMTRYAMEQVWKRKGK